MTAKQYLRKIKDYQESIQRVENEIYGLKAVSYDKDRIQSSPDDHLPSDMSVIIDLRRRYIVFLADVLNRIDRIEKPEYITLLKYRYIDMASWNRIGDRLRINYETVLNYHGKALRAFAEKNSDIIGDNHSFS